MKSLAFVTLSCKATVPQFLLPWWDGISAKFHPYNRSTARLPGVRFVRLNRVLQILLNIIVKLTHCLVWMKAHHF